MHKTAYFQAFYLTIGHKKCIIIAYLFKNLHIFEVYQLAKVFIDGSAGTTGLRIYERLATRKDIELITLSEELRKNIDARKEALNKADIAFLCLPDAAAIEAVSLMENEKTVIIDTSTAHRTNDAWAYGFPELEDFRKKISISKRIANPGCHATGFISLVKPLVEKNIINADEFLNCFSLTGYSGGGKLMIADYESDGEGVLCAPRMYGLSQQHKHLPEMSKICKIENEPIFSPIVSSYYSGMQVVVPLNENQINGDIEDIKRIYREYYNNKVVSYFEGDENGFLSASKLSGKDNMLISVFGNNKRITLVSRFDNLGKGASGAAIQNMNIVLGVEETTGLNI